MGTRAYKIISKKLAKEPSFNSGNDGYVLDLIYTDNRNNDGCGELEFCKEDIEKALKNYKVKKEKKIKTITCHTYSDRYDIDEVIDTLEQMIKDFKKGEDFITYDCF